MTTLPVNATEDFTGDTLSNIDLIQFGDADQIIATFASDQFGPGEILNTVTLDGDRRQSRHRKHVRDRHVLGRSMGARGLDGVRPGTDSYGTSGDDTIIGTDGNDQIGTPVGTQNGADSLLGGDADVLEARGRLDRRRDQGGSGFDAILLQTATTYDLSATTIGDVEQININQVTTAVLDGPQIGVGKIATIAGSPGGGAVQALVVNGSSVDLTGVDFIRWEAIDTVTINGTNAILNTLVGSDQKDTIGGTGNSTDFITGGDGADTLNGGGGSDFFRYLSAGEVDFETVNGGDGADTIRLENTGLIGLDGATITGVETLDFFSGTSTAILAGDQLGTGKIDAVSGSSGVDALVVTTDDDELTDLSDVEFTGWTDGTDTITILGTTGGDTLFGSAQADTIEGESGADAMSGGGGNDTYVVDISNDSVNETAGEGTDLVQSSVTYALSLSQEIENLTLTGNTAINGTGNNIGNVITGNSNANTLAGLGGNDTLNGAGGTDTASYAGAAAGVTVSLAIATAQDTIGDGTDTLSSIENLTGSNFADTLTGNSGDNISGGNQDDALNGGNGNDALQGGAGIDTASYAGANAAVTVSLNVGGAQNTGGAGTDTLSSVEKLIGYYGFGDTLTGSGGDNTLSGGNGVDTLNGEGGGDRLDGGTGADNMAGGTGNDTYVVDAAGDTVTEAAGGGIDTVESSVSHTLAANVENLLLTGTAGTNGTGNALANTITGTSGVNRIDGGALGDNMAGGNGNDTYVVDSAGDTIAEQAGFGIDTVESSVSHTLATNVEKLTLTGTAGINGTGNALVNTIIGNSGANRIDGGIGADQMQGGLGNDTYVVDSGSDVVTEAAGEGVDGVESSVTHTLAANVENLTLTGAAGTNGTGNALANILIGNTAANRIDGDALNDTLTGGTGNDDFVFDDGDGADTVTDFQNGADQFDLSAVAGVNAIGDLTITDNGATVTVNYGSGSFTIANLADPTQLDAGDFVF